MRPARRIGRGGPAGRAGHTERAERAGRIGRAGRAGRVDEWDEITEVGMHPQTKGRSFEVAHSSSERKARKALSKGWQYSVMWLTQMIDDTILPESSCASTALARSRKNETKGSQVLNCWKGNEWVVHLYKGTTSGAAGLKVVWKWIWKVGHLFELRVTQLVIKEKNKRYYL